MIHIMYMTILCVFQIFKRQPEVIHDIDLAQNVTGSLFGAARFWAAGVAAAAVASRQRVHEGVLPKDACEQEKDDSVLAAIHILKKM